MPFLVVAVAISAAVGFLVVSNLRRYVLLVGLGVVAAVVLLVVAYLLAPTSDPGTCSDCEEYLGRWWEPGLAVFILVWLLAAWAFGLALGPALREYRARRKPVADDDA